MKHILLALALVIYVCIAQAQDTTTILQGKNLILWQKSTDSVLMNVKRGGATLLSLIAPQGTAQNPYLSLAPLSGDVNGRPPYMSIGGNWAYGSGSINPAKAKLILYGAGSDSTRYIGMGVNSGRGMEFYKGVYPGFYFNGRVAVSNGASLSTTTITDSAIVIGNGWNYTAAGAVAYLAVNGGYYSGSGDASQARLRLYSSGSNIVGFGLSTGGVEYYSGALKRHVFWGDIVGNGKFYQKDTIYFGPNATYDGIGANYLSIGRKLGGPMSNPARLELNGSYSDELNKPTKAKIWLFGDTDASIIGFGITASSGMEIFTGTPGLATFHGLAKYDVNRASQFNARTLVDKGYVDSVKSATMKQWTGLNSDTSNIFHNGNVGIGVAAAPNAADRLVVNGNIRAKRVIVTLQGWGDYVFDSAYNLRPLDQVADYVKQHKHLPDMHPAKQLEKDGADMGEVVKQQQVKIEELTLYIIEQNKKQQALQQQLDEQMKMIRDLQQEKSDHKAGK